MQHFGLFISHKNASCRAVLCATSDTDYDHPCKGCANAVFHRLPMQGQFICVLQTGFILRTKMNVWWSTVSIMLCFMGYLVITSLHIYIYILEVVWCRGCANAQITTIIYCVQNIKKLWQNGYLWPSCP